MFSPLVVIAASLSENPSLLVPLGGGEPAVLELVARVRATRTPCRIAVTTSSETKDDPLAAFLRSREVPIHRGDRADVLDRVLRAAELFGAEAIMILSADLPLPDVAALDETLEAWSPDLDRLVQRRVRGDAIQMLSYDALVTAWQEAASPEERANTNTFFDRRSERFRSAEVRALRRRPPSPAPAQVR